MVTLHFDILEKDGKKAFAVLPYEEFEKVREELEAYEDLKALRSAKAQEKDASATSLREVREDLKI